MARIRWIEEHDAEGETAAIYEQVRATSPRGNVADIIKTMSLRPDFLSAINNAAAMHFSDGALTRAQHEMIASYVAAVNRCHY
ncbi:MAG TPA: hypothetical protein VHT75_15305 [Acidimicrobiales bacterium]|jgi:hypothetical protein|nr:hypothetical protein [Acidimicrobiales bacterium]